MDLCLVQLHGVIYASNYTISPSKRRSELVSGFSIGLERSMAVATEGQKERERSCHRIVPACAVPVQGSERRWRSPHCKMQDLGSCCFQLLLGPWWSHRYGVDGGRQEVHPF